MVKEQGGGSNYLCLSESPVFMENEAGIEDGARARVYGVEYTKTFSNGMLNEDAPCAVCQSRRKASLMIPATNQCVSGWTTEYTGFLVAANAVIRNALSLYVWTGILSTHYTVILLIIKQKVRLHVLSRLRLNVELSLVVHILITQIYCVWFVAVNVTVISKRSKGIEKK